MGHPIFARAYARVAPSMDSGGLLEYRRRLLSGLAGPVIEIGAGSGLNFSHYPPGVSRVLAVEPEPYLRKIASVAAAQSRVPVELVAGFAECLPAEREAFDGAIAALVLCSVHDQARALHEIHRTLKPGGQLRFLEHVLAETPGLRITQRGLDATIWPLLCGGCHVGRNTLAAIEDAGFRIETFERFRFPDTRVPSPSSTHVFGVAIKPAD